MFKIGEFSKIAHINARLLRHYDEIGLFKPSQVDPHTGYRYYSTAQLPVIYRIMALKELGFSLNQITRLLQDHISPEEIRGMLVMKQAEIERAVVEEIRRLRQVELRLQQIEHTGQPMDVVVKPVPAQPFFSVRTFTPTFQDAVQFFRQVYTALPAQTGSKLGYCVTVAHSPELEEELDFEVGFLVEDLAGQYPSAFGDYPTRLYELPAVERMATIMHRGGDGYLTGDAIGHWMEINGYDGGGPWREVYLHVDFERDVLLELQVPITERSI